MAEQSSINNVGNDPIGQSPLDTLFLEKEKLSDAEAGIKRAPFISKGTVNFLNNIKALNLPIHTNDGFIPINPKYLVENTLTLNRILLRRPKPIYRNQAA